MPRILIVQPYVPSYRVPLFTELDRRLSERGSTLLVAAGSPQGADAARADAVQDRPWLAPLEQANVRIAGRTLQRRLVRPTLADFRPTHVIVEQALHNFDTYELAMWARRAHAPVAMWGHGRTYTVSASRAQELLKAWMTRRASWFFAYTDGGRDYLRDHGFPVDRITVLRNSTDTAALQRDLAAVSDADLDAFRTRHHVEPDRAALFLGGLDDRKGLPFLLDAARRVAQEVPGFVLILGGDGVMLEELRAAERAGAPLRVLGRLDGRNRAVAMRSAGVMTIPEWVGLVAVDSLAAGIPIVTTVHPRHAPEFEYLHPGVDAVVTAHEPDAYARGIIGLLGDPARRSAMGAACREAAIDLSIERMADRFVDGITAWTSAPH
jgi:glycosyltransferase involved in cell wall biosynthesis